MANNHASASLTSDVRLREVSDDDLPAFFEYQREPEANQRAAFPARDRDAFMTHWAKIRRDDAVTIRAILFDGQVAGNIVSWQHDGKRVAGYWIGKTYWGRGVATKALLAFLKVDKTRPLYTYVAKLPPRSASWRSAGSRRAVRRRNHSARRATESRSLFSSSAPTRPVKGTD
jgi:hypothetical protein